MRYLHDNVRGTFMTLSDTYDEVFFGENSERLKVVNILASRLHHKCLTH